MDQAKLEKHKRLLYDYLPKGIIIVRDDGFKKLAKELRAMEIYRCSPQYAKELYLAVKDEWAREQE